MVSTAFDYVRADSYQAAVQLLAEHGEDAKILAGGQSSGLTRPQVDSTIDLRGRIATLDRGIQDVANKVPGEFATRLSNEMRTTAAADRTAISAAMAAHPAAGSASTQPAPARVTAGHDDGSVEALPASPGAAPTAAYSQTPPIKAGALLWSILRDMFKQVFRRHWGKR